MWKLLEHARPTQRAYGFILIYFEGAIARSAGARISETTWLFEPFCLKPNDYALFISLLFAFYLITTVFPPDAGSLRSPLESDA